MLNVLKGYKPEQIEDLLSEVAESLLPNPGVGSSLRSSKISDDLKMKILEEIRSRLGLRFDDKSPEAYGRILESLADEMADQTLLKADLSAVKARVAHVSFAYRP
jgi:hypothetical protein